MWPRGRVSGIEFDRRHIHPHNVECRLPQALGWPHAAPQGSQAGSHEASQTGALQVPGVDHPQCAHPMAIAGVTATRPLSSFFQVVFIDSPFRRVVRIAASGVAIRGVTFQRKSLINKGVR